MATNMKTIKFGENGETYCVNAWPVQVSGELASAANNIDFGTFDGLTEVNIATAGVAGTEGNYCFITINGTQSAFVSRLIIYKSNVLIQIKKVGGIWFVLAMDTSNGVNVDMAGKCIELLGSADSITSISLQSYGGTDFPAGMNYYLEGR